MENAFVVDLLLFLWLFKLSFEWLIAQTVFKYWSPHRKKALALCKPQQQMYEPPLPPTHTSQLPNQLKWKLKVWPQNSTPALDLLDWVHNEMRINKPGIEPGTVQTTCFSSRYTTKKQATETRTVFSHDAYLEASLNSSDWDLPL